MDSLGFQIKFCGEHRITHVTPYCRMCVAEEFMACKTEDYELDDMFAQAPSSEDRAILNKRVKYNEQRYNYAVARAAANARFETETSWPKSTVDENKPAHELNVQVTRATFAPSLPFSR